LTIREVAYPRLPANLVIRFTVPVAAGWYRGIAAAGDRQRGLVVTTAGPPGAILAACEAKTVTKEVAYIGAFPREPAAGMEPGRPSHGGEAGLPGMTIAGVAA
jgi:hypothetical protein